MEGLVHYLSYFDDLRYIQPLCQFFNSISERLELCTLWTLMHLHWCRHFTRSENPDYLG